MSVSKRLGCGASQVQVLATQRLSYPRNPTWKSRNMASTVKLTDTEAGKVPDPDIGLCSLPWGRGPNGADKTEIRPLSF